MWLVTPKGDMLNIAIAWEIHIDRQVSTGTAEVVVFTPSSNYTIARGTIEHCEAAVEHVAQALAVGTPVIYMNTKGA